MRIESRSPHLALALAICCKCHGAGAYTVMKRGSQRPDQLPEFLRVCSCVYRRVFGIVLNKYHDCAAGGHLQPIWTDGTSKPKHRRINYGRKPEEFCADVWLTAKRVLTDQNEWAVFRFHYLWGADWKLCGRKLGMDKGTFFHVAYRVEERLGRIFMEMKPYALYPLDCYFSRFTGPVDIRPRPLAEPRYPNGIPLRPPLAGGAARVKPKSAPLIQSIVPVAPPRFHKPRKTLRPRKTVTMMRAA